MTYRNRLILIPGTLILATWLGASQAAEPASAGAGAEPLVLALGEPAPAAAADTDDYMPRRRKHGAITVRTGNFKLADTEQSVSFADYRFDSEADEFRGIEFEARHSGGFTTGFEIFSYTNAVDNLTLSSRTDVKVLTLGPAFKKYFEVTRNVYPYLGLGFGASLVNFGGSGTGSGDSIGLGYQGMAGVELRYGFVGINAQYKYFNATAQDIFQSDVNIGGSSINVGLSLLFY